MWHAGTNYTKEEKEVLRELEYDLFMCNPGFRSMWNNNFEQYFQALFDKKMWEEREMSRELTIHDNTGIRMIEDPEFAKFMKEQAIIDEVMLGEMKIENAPFEMQEEIRSQIKESEELNRDFVLREILGVQPDFIDEEDEEEKTNPLLKTAKDWSMELSKIAGPLYEQTKNIDLFRIINNCGLVASKIVGARAIDYSKMDKKSFDFAWRIDRTDYNLSLTSLRRCMESLLKIADNEELANKINTEKFLMQAREIQPQLIDLLDTIEQERFKV